MRRKWSLWTELVESRELTSKLRREHRTRRNQIQQFESYIGWNFQIFQRTVWPFQSQTVFYKSVDIDQEEIIDKDHLMGLK